MLVKWTIVALAASVGLILGPPTYKAVFAPSVSIDVDFGASAPTASMSGLINGFGDNFTITDDKIGPLRLQNWRGSDTHLPTAKRLSLPVREILMSNLWGYPGRLRGGRKVMPFQDWSAWEQFCKVTAQAQGSANTVYDIWNEPDQKQHLYWNGSDDDFFECYIRAFRAIRSVQPNAIVGGPSITLYNTDFISRFCDACKSAGVECNFLSYHELAREDNIPAAATRLKDARSRFLNGSAYSGLKMRWIYINEFLGQTSQDHPGAIVGYMRALENGKADGACKSCWPDPDGNSTCFDNSLDGLLTHDGQHRKATWWAWKDYADAVNHRVSSESSIQWVQPLAGIDDDGSGNVLVGYYGWNIATTSASVQIRMRNLSRIGIPDGASFSWSATLLAKGSGADDVPPTFAQGTATSSGGSATVQMDGIPADGAIELLVKAR